MRRILQGDIYWVDFGSPTGSEPGYTHPAVVVQSDSFNKGTIDTVVVCEVSKTRRLAKFRGNVQLISGEGGLREDSVVNITQVWTVNKTDLKDKIGTLHPEQVREIIDGLLLLLGERRQVFS